MNTSDICCLSHYRPSRNGRPHAWRDGKNRLHYRVAWEDASGAPIPEGMCVCHTCDTPNCIRADGEGLYWANGAWHPRRGHLWLGTHADNVADRVAKGRSRSGPLPLDHYDPEEYARRGERHPRAKLTDDDVRAIRARHENRRWGYTETARLYGVSRKQINTIVLRRAWPHVDPDPDW